jgi:hypothetical protein
MLEAPALNVAHALVVYAEPLVAQRRVVVLGDSSLGLDVRLVELGARIVHVYDTDAPRARANAKLAARGAVIRELPEGDLDVRPGAFDLAIVPDLAIATDRAAVLARVRKLVGTDGAALIAARTASASDETLPTLDYYEMFDLVALQFASVRMIGQVPFTGVAFAELGDAAEAPSVSVDTQLASENEAPEVTIALVAQRDVRLDPYALIQLPRAAPSDAIDALAMAASATDHAELAAAVLRTELLQAQVEEQKVAILRLGAEGERAHRVDELEAALHERTAKLKDAETRAGEHYVRAERLTHDVRRLDDDLARQRDRATRLAKELEDERQHRARAEGDLAALRKSPDAAQWRERIVLLEEALQSSEGAAALLQQRVMEAERAIRRREEQLVALVAELELARATPSMDPAVLAALAARAQSAEARAAMLDAHLAELGEGHASELAQLEAVLRERAQAIAAAEREVMRREAIVRELVLALEDAGAGEAISAPSHAAARVPDETHAHLDRAVAENADLRTKLDALALDVARREGELQARGWRITELEERVASLEARPLAAPPPAKSSAAGVTPAGDHAELHALRQALAQEHEARVRAESGEELGQEGDPAQT